MAAIQEAQTAKLRSAITEAVNAGVSEIYLAISSTGGNVADGLAVAALIKSLPMNVITHNIGQMDSVATVIFAAGKRRCCNSLASFTFHGVTLPLNANYTEHQLLELHEQLKRLRSMISTTFSAYTGVALEEVSEWVARNGGTILSAADGVAKGIVHEVREFKIPQGAQILTIGNA